MLIFSGSRFFLHGVCPVLCIVTFCCFINSHLIRFWEALLALVPVLCYTAVYLTMVVFIGEDNGGWNDFYGFVTRAPLWVSLLVILPLTFGIVMLLRFCHNKCCERRRSLDAELYRKAYSGEDLAQVVENMARSHRNELKTNNIVIPAQTIGYMIQNCGEGLDVAEGCRRYLEAYLQEK